jgi:hypothetical protein
MSKKEEASKKDAKKPAAKKTKKVAEKEAVRAPENTAITKKMGELTKVVEKASKEGSGTMLCLVLGEAGIHISMTGNGEDVAILVASAMSSHEQIGAVIAQGGMMAAMRKQEEARINGMDEDGAEEAPAEMPSPTTEA